MGTLRGGKRKNVSVQTRGPYTFPQRPALPGSGPLTWLTPLLLTCPLRPPWLAPTSGPRLPCSFCRALCPLPAAWPGSSPPADAGLTSPSLGCRSLPWSHYSATSSSFPPSRPPASGRGAESPGCWANGVSLPLSLRDFLWGIIFGGDPPWIRLPSSLPPPRCSEAKPSLSTERKSRK